MSSQITSFFIRVALVLCIGMATCVVPVLSTSPGLTILRSDRSSLQLRFEPQRAPFDTVQVLGQLRLKPRFKGLSATSTTSLQESSLACLREMICVPGPSRFQIESCTIRYTESSNQVPMGSDKAIPVVKKSIHYSRTAGTDNNRNVLSPWLQLEYTGQSASQHIARLIVLAEQKETDSKLCILNSLELNLSFDAAANNSTTTQTGTQFSLPFLNANVATSFRDELSTRVVRAEKQNGPVVLSSDKSDGIWVKMSIGEEGIYHVDAAALSSLGYSIPPGKVSTIKVFGNGGREMSEQISPPSLSTMPEQPIIVRTKQDGSLDDVVFYGAGCRGFAYDASAHRVTHFINHYAESNYYFLTWGGGPGKRMTPAAEITKPVVNVPTQYTGRVALEHELSNAYIAGSGRRWFGEQLDAVVPRTFNTKLPGLLRSGKVSYYIDVAHRTPSTGTVTVKENGKVASTLSLPPLDVSVFAYQDFRAVLGIGTLDASQIASDATSILQFEYASSDGSSASSGLLDFFEIHYPAQMSANDDRISFVSDLGLSGVSKYNFSGFSSGTIFGVDVTNPSAPVQLSNISNTGGIFTFLTELDSTPRRFCLAASFNSPQLSKVEWQGLRDTMLNTDLVVICAKDLRNSALRFAEYRRAHSKMKVAVVNVEDIYNEYGSGIGDPSSIRDFIKDASTRWTYKPHYVLLWGDGHYDYKYVSTQKKNYVATWQSDDPIPRPYEPDYGTNTDTYTTDDFFACVIGDDRLEDLAIGRLPIDSPETGEWMVDKIKHYEESSAQDVWRTTATFVADDGPKSNNETDGSLHLGQSEQLTNDYSLIPQDVVERKIYLSEYPAENIPKGRLKPGVTADLISMVNNHGTLFLNWIGHGNPKVWAHETVLSRDITIPQFVNIDKLFFMAAESCDFGRFDLTDNQSGSEVMLFSKNGSAIGTFASARVSFASSNAIIGQELFKQFYTRDTEGKYRTMGDVVLATKVLHTYDNDRKYFLLGDPTCRVLIPNLVVEFDSLNGHSADSTTVAAALSTVRVKGHIVDLSSKKLVDDFGGSVTLSLFDSDILRRFQDPSGLAIGDSTVFQVLKLGGALHRGNYSVNNGRFEAEFVIPKDISFSNKNGRLFAYANADDHREAKGETKSLVIGGILSSVNDDQDGPDLQIFVDSRRFQAGDVVRSNPLLILDMADKTGINSTGIGIGHKIEAWIDDNSQSIDMSDSYSSSLLDAHAGSAVKQIFNLSPGFHQVRARVWDVLNNVSTAQTYFTVGTSDSSVDAARILIYPNPYSSMVNIMFTHNQSYGFVAEARIYTPAGHLVRTLSQEVSNPGFGNFQWDATDNDGLIVSQGSYTVVLVLHAPNGSVETKAAQIVYMKD